MISLNLDLVGIRLDSLDISVISSGIKLFNIFVFIKKEEAIKITGDSENLQIKTHELTSSNLILKKKTTSEIDNIFNDVRDLYNTYDYFYIEEMIRPINSSSAVKGTDIDVYGYIINGTNQLVLFNDYRSDDINDRGNIEIDFPFIQYDENNNKLDNQGRINNCYFGALYGISNLKNRLFVGGDNNIIYHTDTINMSALSDNKTNLNEDDLLYFPALSYQYVGRNENKIVGFDVSSNNKLIVFKDKSFQESTIYYIEGQLSEIDDLGVSREVYTIKQGNNGLTAYNHSNIVNYNGYTLFLSTNKTIQRLLNQENLIGDTKYSTEISYYIDNYLLNLENENYKNGRLIITSKYLFTCFDDVCFISSIEEVNNGNFEYYPLNIKGVNDIIEIDNDDYLLGLSDGKLVSYSSKNEYQDVYFDLINDTTIEDDYNIVLSESDISNYKVGQEVILDGVGYISFGTFDNLVGTSQGSIKSEYEFLISENRTIYTYITRISTETKKEEIVISEYKLERIDDVVYIKGKVLGNETSEILGSDTNITSKIYIKYYNDNLTINSIDNENSTITLSFKGVNILDYEGINLGDINIDLSIRKYTNTPVNAFFITKPFSMGTTTYYKNIISFTVSNPTLKDSNLNVGMIGNKTTSRESRYVSSVSTSRLGLDLAKIYFGAVDFEETNIPLRVYTKFQPFLNQVFTNFILYSETSENSILNDLEVVYRIGQKVRG